MSNCIDFKVASLKNKRIPNGLRVTVESPMVTTDHLDVKLAKNKDWAIVEQVFYRIDAKVVNNIKSICKIFDIREIQLKVSTMPNESDMTFCKWKLLIPKK